MPTQRPRALISVVLVTVLTLLVAACGGGTSEGGTPEGADASPTGEYAYDDIHGAAEHMEVWAVELAASLDEHADLGGDPQSPAAELLAGLDFTLREHVVALTDTSAATIAGEDLAAEHAREVLDQNTEALESRMRTLFSEDEADEFGRLWDRHVEQMLNVATALRDDDQAVKGRAREELERINGELATVLQDMTRGRIEPEELEQTLEEHVATSVAVMEAQAEQGEDPFTPLREAVDHMTHVAEQMAVPFAQTVVIDGEVDSEAAKMHAELSGRMAESVWFTSDLTEHVLHDEPIDAARELVDHNTSELGDVIAGPLGSDAAEIFEEVWTTHIDLFVEYARAVRSGDADAREDTREDLARWADEFATTMGDAGGEAIEATVVEEAAVTHLESVIGVIEEQGHAA